MHAIVEDLFYDRAAAPVALLFGDDAGRREQLARLIAAQGCRVAGEASIAGASARLDGQAVAHIVVVDATGGGGEPLDRLLARIASAGAARRFEALVLVPEGMIDLAGPLLGIAGVALVVAGAEGRYEETEVVAALAGLHVASPRSVAEESEEARRRRLAVLGEEAGRIARALAAMAAEPAGDAAASSIDPGTELAFLRGHIRVRQLRARWFDAALFADPAWDILLDLRLAALEGRRVSVSSLCIAAAVPPTTGLRWIGVMTAKGQLERFADPDDGRRTFLRLGREADAAMTRFAAMALRA